MSALGQKQTYALQKAMSALPPIATAKADFRKRSCPLYPRKQTLICTERVSNEDWPADGGKRPAGPRLRRRHPARGSPTQQRTRLLVFARAGSDAVVRGLRVHDRIGVILHCARDLLDTIKLIGAGWMQVNWNCFSHCLEPSCCFVSQIKKRPDSLCRASC